MWLPNPPDGTDVAGGFDGSENDDWTGITLETREGRIFTPRYGPDKRPAVWIPSKEPGGRIPRAQVKIAWTDITRRYKLARAYCDPGFNDETSWETEIEDWQYDLDVPENTFVMWPTNQMGRMYPAIRRFEADLPRTITHDGCPLMEAAMRNARKIAKPGDKYTIGKPAQHQKIDLAVTAILAHEAACDERATPESPWNQPVEPPALVFGLR